MTAERSVSSFVRPPLDAEALVGLPGDVVGALEPYTEADPAALLLHVLAMLGNAAGDGLHWPVGSTAHPARLFVVIVGDAASGRKGTAGDAISDLMRRAEPEWFAESVERGIQSAEALIRRVAAEHRLLVFESEFARLLGVAGQAPKLSPVIRAAFDGQTLSATVKDMRGSLRAERPHVSIVGHVQPVVLADRLPDVERSSGFADRFLFGLVGRTRYLPDGGGRVDEAVLDGLADRIRGAVDAAWERALAATDPISRRLFQLRGTQPRVEMPRSAETRARWRELYGEGNQPGPLNRHRPGIVGQVTGRAHVHVMRLAVTYAIADCSATVEIGHLEAAHAVWRYCEASAQAVFGSATGDRDVDRALKALREAPDHRMTRTDVSVLFGRGRTARRLDEICRGLVETGLVTAREERNTVGRPAHVYTYTPPPKNEQTEPDE